MKNNKKKTRMTKVEKRRLAFEKRNVKKEQNLARYGAEGGSALVMAKTTEFNRRIIAAVLALVFVLTTIVVGYNFAAKADDPDDGFKMFESIDDSGFVTRKGIKLDDKGTKDTTDDTYDLRMEAYATAPIATKTLDTKTPLDIVMVMDQSGSMEENKDVYTKIDESLSDEFTIEQAIGKYYHDEDGHDYPLNYEECTDNYVIARLNGEETSNWTAEDVGGYGRPLYYLNSSTNEYELVTPDKKPYYTRVDQNISFYDNFEQHYNDNNPTKASGYYAYIPDNPYTWRPVWYRVRGRMLDGYYYTLYYYIKSANGYSFTGRDAMDQEIADGNIEILGDGIDAYKVVCSRVGLLITDDYYEGKDLYTISSSNAPIYNYMDTESGVLAFPAPGGAYAGSETYSGNLYTKAYQLFYMKGEQKVPVGKPVFNTNTDIAYNVSDENGKRLYEEKYISRLEAMKRAASQVVTNLGETDVDARVSLVGFTNAGNVLTTPDLVTVNETDSDTSHIEELNGLINNISVSETNGSDLSAGLNTAGHVFSNDTVNDGSRKRIVLVFTDVQPNEDNNSWATTKDNAFSVGAALKDTYNASVYTVGICINDDDTQSELEKLSSKYFSPTKEGASEIPAGDNTAYYFNITSLESTEMAGDTLKDTVYFITQTLQSPYTSVALNDANSILKDIISDNFDFPDTFTDADKLSRVIIETASVDSYPADGELQWQEAVPASFNKAWEGKTLTVDGFDYNFNFVSAGRDEGQKIIVTITGLKLKANIQADSNRRIYSNDTMSGIYKKGKENTLFATFPRPFVDYKTQLAPEGSAGLPDAESGIVVNKYLSTNANGNYDLTIEAYTTKTSTTKTEKIPTDFIVVADQSGSMAYKDMATTYTDAGATYLETIAEDAAKGETEGYPDGYYYHDASTDNYYRVYPVRSYLYEYIPSETKWTQNIIEDAGMDLSWFQREEEATYSKANQYYYKTSDNVYRPVKVTATGKLGTYYIEFSYKDANGATVDFVRPSKPVYKNVFGSDTSKYGPGSFGYGAVNAAVLTAYPRPTAYTYSEFLGVTTGMYINYPMYKRHVGYTELRYRDVNGVEHTVPASNGNSTWEYCNSSGQAKTTASGSSRPTYTNLYKGSGKITRLQALKNALSEFATAVADEKDDYHNPVDNRIAIVGFSSNGYNNTELLTGTNLTINNKNGKQKSDATTNDYATALVSATSGTDGDVNVNSKVTDAINALTANGGTQPQDGLEMAYSILQNRDKATYTTESTGETVDRNVFVIFFTDGHPGDYEYSDMYSAANKVVEKAKLIKDYRVNHSGVTVADEDVVIPSLFSIGVFGESDGNPLTYLAHTDSTDKNYDYLFESGHMDTYRYSSSRYYYLNRNWIASDATEYGSTANDTIFDYMSVVSSNYPNATKYMNVTDPGVADKGSYATYIDMVNGVRNSSTASNTNKFYRMASNQETLVAAFEQAVTRATQSISADQRLDANSVMKDVFKNTNFVTTGDTAYNFASVVGSMDRNGVVNFNENTKEILYLPYEVETDENNNIAHISVTGFDYLANYINNKTATDNGMIDTPHDGKKLVTTITNVVPTGQTGNKLESNISPNSAMYFNGNTLAGKPFPTPEITSYKYTLDVGVVNKNAAFDVTATVWNPNAEEGEEAVDKDSDMLEDVIIVYPNGERHRYSEVGAQTFYGMKNGQKFYFENLPSSYQIKTDVSSTDDAYDYSIYYDNDPSDKTDMEKGQVYPKEFSYANHTINISSTRGDKPISIREETVGTYADMTLEFGEAITMEIPVVDGEDHAGPFKYDCTFDTYHNFGNETIPKGATYKAVFEKEREADGTIYAKLTGFEWAKNGDNSTWRLTTDGFPMQTGDEITITVKGGDTVKVNEVVTHDYGVTYYSGQDDVDPNDIKLKGLDGSLLTGQYELTLIPVDGTEGDKKTLTFNNGILQDETDPIDLALYQSISSATDLSEATLDISGETFNFDYETDGENEAYVATIRDITVEPPASATVEKNKMDILIVNRMGEIPIESVYDNGHSHIIVYILSGVGILALTAGGYYVWKKKDEFLEQ